jgi:hypothetical protein
MFYINLSDKTMNIYFDIEKALLISKLTESATMDKCEIMLI